MKLMKTGVTGPRNGAVMLSVQVLLRLHVVGEICRVCVFQEDTLEETLDRSKISLTVFSLYC